MYAIYTTQGLIIDSRPYGEAGKLVSIFTRDFGLVTAAASGIRFERSKLRYHSQDYSFGTFSLVRGREFWRLTSAQEESGRKQEAGVQQGGPAEARKEIKGAAGSQELVARLALLLRRLLHGEEANAGLFDCIESALRFIHGNDLDPGAADAETLNEERLKTLESLVVIRIMHHLGYIGDVAGLNGHVISHELNAAMLDSLAEKRPSMNCAINQALKESHL